MKLSMDVELACDVEVKAALVFVYIEESEFHNNGHHCYAIKEKDNG